MERMQVFIQKYNLNAKNIDEIKNKMCDLIYAKRAIEYDKSHDFGKTTKDMNNYILGLGNFNDDISKKYIEIIDKIKEINDINNLESILVEQDL